VYDLQPETGALTPAPTPFFSCALASGPCSFCFHSDGQWCYLVTEIDSTVVPLAYDAATSALSPVGPAVETLSEDWHGLDDLSGDGATGGAGATKKPTGEAPKGKKRNFTAHIEVSPDGRFVYGSNRGHGSIVTYKVDDSIGALTLVSHTHGGGQSPRAFSIHPSGRWLLARSAAYETRSASILCEY
jgi:6-phosphogluconolactonase